MANELGNVSGGATTGAGLGTMLLPGIGTAIGAGAGGLMGLIKSIIDSGNEKKERMEKSTMMRYSPWTKLAEQAAKPTQNTDTLGTLMASVAGGAQQGQAAQKSAADNARMAAMAEQLKGPQQQSQQQGPGAAPVIATQEERGAAPAQAPAAAESGLGDLLNGQNPDQIMKILRMAQAQRKSYGSVG